MSLKNPVTPPGIDPGAVRVVEQRLNHYATPGPTSFSDTRVKYQENLFSGLRVRPTFVTIYGRKE
jgi:hypothetical protein